ncbi:hypothetical protein CRUP_024313 [Coryphaenoides rupestris]|nr:hypothetical protein CRUP_024313 [Coryphaenoides rupestris]
MGEKRDEKKIPGSRSADGHGVQSIVAYPRSKPEGPTTEQGPTAEEEGPTAEEEGPAAAEGVPVSRRREKRCSCENPRDKECVYFCHVGILWVNTPRRLSTPIGSREAPRPRRGNLRLAEPVAVVTETAVSGFLSRTRGTNLRDRKDTAGPEDKLRKNNNKNDNDKNNNKHDNNNNNSHNNNNNNDNDKNNNKHDNNNNSHNNNKHDNNNSHNRNTTSTTTTTTTLPRHMCATQIVAEDQ